MKRVLVLATTISFVAVVGSAGAQMVPGRGPMVPNSPPPLPTKVRVFTVKSSAPLQEWTCDQGSIQSLSAVHGAENRNVSVVFLQDDKPIPEDTPTPANGFRFEQTPQDQVRVTMVCGG
jgi:hypothetical protein